VCRGNVVESLVFYLIYAIMLHHETGKKRSMPVREREEV